MTDLASPASPIATARHPWLVLSATMMGVMLITLDVSVVNVAVESLRQAFGVGISGLQWVLNAYTLAYAVFLLSAGALGDRIGPRATFLLGFVIFTLASLACGLASSLGVLIAARFVQGIGAALLVPSAMSLIRHIFPDPRGRASAIGLWAGAGSLALAAGPVIGGLLITFWGWRGIFLINLPIGLIGLWLTLRHAPPSQHTGQRGFDLPGQFLGALMLACLTGAITEAHVFGWAHPWIIGGFIAAAIFAVLLLLRESHARDPMLPLGIFRNPSFSAATYVGFAINVAFYGLVFVFSLFFQEIQGKSALATGLAFVPMTGVIILFNITAGRLNMRYSVRSTMTAGLAGATIGYFSLLLITAQSSLAALSPAFVLIGSGVALTVTGLMTASLAGLSPQQSGIGSGVLNAARQVGGAIGVALFGSLIAADPQNFIAGLHIAIAVSGAAILSALIVAFAFIAKT